MELKSDIITKVMVSLFISVGIGVFSTNVVYGEELSNTYADNNYEYGDAKATSKLNESTHEIINYAYSFIGKPYVFGGNGPNSFDCSGFTRYVYNHFGINIPRTSTEQFNIGTPVLMKELRTGDLIFFNTYTNKGHVGIYIGGGDFIHAASSGSVKVSSLNDGYYNSHYAGAKRVS